MRTPHRTAVALTALTLAAALAGCSDAEDQEPGDDGPVGTSPLIPSEEPSLVPSSP